MKAGDVVFTVGFASMFWLADVALFSQIITTPDRFTAGMDAMTLIIISPVTLFATWAALSNLFEWLRR